MLWGKEWNILTHWEEQLLFCLLQIYFSSPFLFHFFLKLRNVVRENENTLNIQFFCFKCKKLTHHKAEERWTYCSLSCWVLACAPLSQRRRYCGVKEKKKGNTEHLKMYKEKCKKCLTLIWTTNCYTVGLSTHF